LFDLSQKDANSALMSERLFGLNNDLGKNKDQGLGDFGCNTLKTDIMIYTLSNNFKEQY